MQAVTRLLEGRDFASLDEANAFPQQLASRQPLAAPPVTPLDEAQELVYQALEASGPRRLRLGRRRTRTLARLHRRLRPASNGRPRPAGGPGTL